MPDSEAVTIWRKKWKYNLSAGRKSDIDVTVQDLELWKQVLDNWGYWSKGKWISHNPFSVGKQLSEYERLEAKRSGQAIVAAASPDERVWRD